MAQILRHSIYKCCPLSFLIRSNMNKIQRYRPTQAITFEDFFNTVTDNGICKYCSGYQECLEAMGEENVQSISGYGCSAFDNTVENIKQFYLIEYCVPIGT